MRSQLTYEEFFRLAEYLKANKERIQQERPSYRAVARQATSELGREYSERNVQTAARICDMAWTPCRNGKLHASPRDVSRVLARSILMIADALDIEIEEKVRRIASGRRLDEEVVHERHSHLPCRIESRTCRVGSLSLDSKRMAGQNRMRIMVLDEESADPHGGKNASRGGLCV